MAVATYADVHGHYPPPFVRGPDGQPWHSWRVLVLPYIEQDPLFKRYKMSEPWDGPHNRELAREMPRTYSLHGREQPNNLTTNYLAVMGTDTMWPPHGKRGPRDITGGTSNTVLIAENRGLLVHWMEPRDLVVETMSFEFNSPRGVSSWHDAPAVVLADATVMRLGPEYSPETLRAMVTIKGKAPLDPAVKPIDDGRLRPVVNPFR